MNTFDPHIVEACCVLKGGDTADQRMTELNALIAAKKRGVRVPNGRGQAELLQKIIKVQNPSIEHE